MNLKILLSIVFFSLLGMYAYAQISWNDHYLFPDQIEQSEEKWNRYYNYSLIGEQRKVHTLKPPLSKDAISAEDSLEVRGCHTADISTIYKTIENYKIIIINEKHHVPADRLFMISLLDSLYQLGFRHLGMEPLWDKTIEGFQKNKYQKISTGNYYSLEPRFGELVRRALEMNYEIFPYEADSSYNVAHPVIPPPTLPDASQMESKWDKEAAEFGWGLDMRDYYQATQIDKKIRENPEEKIVIYCGFQHLEKENSSGWKTMAMWLQEMGHHPLCIDQTYMDGSPLLQNDKEKHKKLPYIFEVISPTQFSRPQVILDSLGNYYVPPIYEYNPKTDNGRDETRRWDITIVHPLPKTKNGRLDYFDGYGYVPVSIPNKWKKKYEEFLVLAYYVNEENDAVPADIIYVDSLTKDKTLYLLPNYKYRLELHTPKGDYKCKKIYVKKENDAKK